jgi:hypothetical protein
METNALLVVLCSHSDSYPRCILGLEFQNPSALSTKNRDYIFAMLVTFRLN